MSSASRPRKGLCKPTNIRTVRGQDLTSLGRGVSRGLARASQGLSAGPEFRS